MVGHTAAGAGAEGVPIPDVLALRRRSSRIEAAAGKCDLAVETRL